MKKAYRSMYIKKNMMSDADNGILKQDIESFNRMMHTAFSWNNHNVSFDDGRSIHLHLKERFSCNDYFANSANRQAKAVISSQKELRSVYVSDMQDDIRSIRKAVSRKEKYLRSLEDVQDSVITYIKDGHSNPAKLKACAGMKFMDNEMVRIQHFNKKTEFDNLYLFEHKWLKPEIKQVSCNIKYMQHKISRLEEKMSALQKDSSLHVCFGTKKLFHDTRMSGQDRLNAIRKRRYAKIAVSGRADSKNGNWVFSYDTVTGDLSYRSMSDWNRTVIFPDVKFSYGQDEINDYITAHKGSVSWEIRDCGNAWQIICVITKPDEQHKNNCHDDGCVSYDMNYDNISFAELDASGNLMHHEIIKLYPEGRTSGQFEQQISHALEHIFKYASAVHKPVACENISSVKRRKFYDRNTKRTRHISMFACSRMAVLAASKSDKYSTAVTSVNPAYTSKTGLLKYKKRYGLSTHESAAFVIGRRGMGIMDRVPDSWKHKLSENKQSLPRLQQWKAVYIMIQKIKYKDLNDMLYPKAVPDDILYSTDF